MPEGRNVSGKQAIRALERMGCQYVRQGKGDHVIVKRLVGDRQITESVPMHNPIKIGTLKGILRKLELDFEEFLKNLLLSGGY